MSFIWAWKIQNFYIVKTIWTIYQILQAFTLPRIHHYLFWEKWCFSFLFHGPSSYYNQKKKTPKIWESFKKGQTYFRGVLQVPPNIIWSHNPPPPGTIAPHTQPVIFLCLKTVVTICHGRFRMRWSLVALSFFLVPTLICERKEQCLDFSFFPILTMFNEWWL